MHTRYCGGSERSALLDTEWRLYLLVNIGADPLPAVASLDVCYAPVVAEQAVRVFDFIVERVHPSFHILNSSTTPLQNVR